MSSLHINSCFLLVDLVTIYLKQSKDLKEVTQPSQCAQISAHFVVLLNRLIAMLPQPEFCQNFPYSSICTVPSKLLKKEKEEEKNKKYKEKETRNKYYSRDFRAR